MRRIVPIVLVLGLLTLGGCSQANSGGGHGWHFKWPHWRFPHWGHR